MEIWKMIPITHLALALVMILIWGFNFISIKLGLDEVSPLLLGFARFFLTSIPAVFFIKRPNLPFRSVVIYGLVMFTLQFALLLMGMYAGVTPGLASLLVQLHVFFSLLLSAVYLKEKCHSWQIIGALIAFGGIALIAMHLGGSVTLTGFLLVIGSAVALVAGNVISKKLGKVNMVSLVIWGSLIAWPPLLAISLIVDGAEHLISTLQHLTWVSGGAILYTTYLSTLLAFGLWSWLLHHHPIGTVAPFTLLVPIIAILSSAAFLNEPLQTWKIIAALLVILGVSINLLSPRLHAGMVRK